MYKISCSSVENVNLILKVFIRMFKIIYDGLFHELVFCYLPKLGALERLRPKGESMCQNFGVYLVNYFVR